MDIRRFFVTLFAVAAATACTTPQQNPTSIPREDLDSLLTSQGLVEPWQVDVYGNGDPRDGWSVYVREKLRQLSPNICVTHRHDFFIEQSATGYGITSSNAIQEVALVECMLAKPEQFVSIVSANGDLPDRNLRRVIEALPTLQQMARARQGALEFHYEGQKLREMLVDRVDPNKIQWVTVYTPDSVSVSFDAGIPFEKLHLTFSFEDDLLSRHVYVSSSVYISGNP